MTLTADPNSASAASVAGASATARFRNDKTGPAEASPERVSLLARQVLDAVHTTIRENGATYDEYNALKAWLIRVGEDGEWPLFLDVWVEHAVEEVASSQRPGSKGTIEGPFYIPGSTRFRGEGTLPMRADEAGTPLRLHGQATSEDGTPLAAAEIEVWHADADGLYSGFAPGLPEGNLRGTVIADGEGRFVVNTIQPAPYQIPTDGACGALIKAAGWHAWRPAHLHVKVSAGAHQSLTTQLYFPGDPHNEDDIASAVKPELMLEPQELGDGTGHQARYDVVLARA